MTQNTNIDELLKPTTEFIEQYLLRVEQGREYSKKQNVVFSCLARNISSVLMDNLSFLFDLNENIFNRVDIVVFENDSSDDTKKVLSACKNYYGNHLHILSEDYGDSWFNSSMTKDIARSNDRTINMAKYRNICKKYINEHLYNKSYAIVLDLDFQQISINGLLNTFGHLANDIAIGGVVGNAYEIKNRSNSSLPLLWNYDSWAFRHTWWLDKEKEIDWYDCMLWFGLWTPSPGLPIMKVNSAFGGMAIYPIHTYLSADYEGYDCEHVCFHKNLYKNPHFNLYLNPSQVMIL